MLKIYCFILSAFLLFTIGCSSEDNTITPNVPTTGEVLLATVAGDSIAINSGLASYSSTVSSGTLNFTDRDSARITFYYSCENNNYIPPISIFYSLNDSVDVDLYSGNNLLVSTTSEQYVDVTLLSPNVNKSFKYRIATSSSPGFSYFKFRDLKIYKK